jgi:DHA1 family bicyclomycin/chloramphenicol resistance-like MFS transporter
VTATLALRDPLERLRARPGRLAALLGALTALGGFTMDSNTSGFPQMRAALHTSTAPVQLTLTASLIGLTLGQLILGPLSDRWGRRLPLLGGLAGYIVLSLACAGLSQIGVLIAVRLLQGICAASGMVIARAIARDLFDGPMLTRFYAQMVSTTMLTPIVAPLIGSQLLPLVGWRGLFVVMAAVGGLMVLGVLAMVPETSRDPDESGAGTLLAGFGRLLRAPRFAAVGITLGLSFGAVMVYTAGASFLLQDHYGLSPRMFGVVTAVTGLGIVVAGQLNVWLPRAWPPEARATVCLGVSSLASGYLVVAVLTGLPLAAVIAGVIAMMVCHGITWPNVMSIGMGLSRRDAGSASALLGAMQFGVGGLVSPIGGLLGPHQAIGTVISMFALIFSASIVYQAAVRKGPAMST